MGWVGASAAAAGTGRAVVSIPERVWGGLERDYLHDPTPCNLFQSLRGFGVGWSYILLLCIDSTKQFQSLRGFGVGWSHERLERMERVILVSIPERVWGGLELSLVEL